MSGIDQLSIFREQVSEFRECRLEANFNIQHVFNSVNVNFEVGGKCNFAFSYLESAPSTYKVSLVALSKKEYSIIHSSF